MTTQEKDWLWSLLDVADECGLDYEDIEPRYLEQQGWDAARECLRLGKQCFCWADSHIHMLVECYDKGMTPEQVQAHAIAESIWPPRAK